MCALRSRQATEQQHRMHLSWVREYLQVAWPEANALCIFLV